jgi:hypothetical protein
VDLCIGLSYLTTAVTSDSHFERQTCKERTWKAVDHPPGRPLTVRVRERPRMDEASHTSRLFPLGTACTFLNVAHLLVVFFLDRWQQKLHSQTSLTATGSCERRSSNGRLLQTFYGWCPSDSRLCRCSRRSFYNIHRNGFSIAKERRLLTRVGSVVGRRKSVSCVFTVLIASNQDHHATRCAGRLTICLEARFAVRVCAALLRTRAPQQTTCLSK